MRACCIILYNQAVDVFSLYRPALLYKKYVEIEPFTYNIGGKKNLSLYGLHLHEKATCYESVCLRGSLLVSVQLYGGGCGSHCTTW